MIEWIGRLQDLERPHEAAFVPVAADWTPTPENINALPYPIRDYLHQMQTRADPAEETRDLVLARHTIRGLDIRLAECETECRRRRGEGELVERMENGGDDAPVLPAGSLNKHSAVQHHT